MDFISGALKKRRMVFSNRLEVSAQVCVYRGCALPSAEKTMGHTATSLSSSTSPRGGGRGINAK